MTTEVKDLGGPVAGVKKEVIDLVQALPDTATLDDILAELHFKMQVDAGLKELDEGAGIDHKDVEKRLEKWLAR